MSSAEVLPLPRDVIQKTKVEVVELLVENGISRIPDMYVRPPQERQYLPTCTSQVQVPLIDLSGLNSEGIERENVLKQLGSACEEWGFFQIVNHGIPVTLMESMMGVAKDFFALSVEEKQAYAALPGIATQGYGNKYAQRENVTRDWRDYFYLLLQPHSIRDYAYWPTKPATFREVMEEYSEETKKLAKRLLAAFSLNLGLPENYLEKALGEPHQNVLINFYPRCPQPELTAGFNTHSDIGAVTLLLQEPGSTALHVRKGDAWIPVINQ
eukprot:Gb_21294 [translate_table: standard]